MVRLGLVSDSHESRHQLERYLEKCNQEQYDAVLHMGDFASDARWLRRRLSVPVISVAGNCDLYSDDPRTATVEFEGHRLLLVHGHLQNVKLGLERLSYFAADISDSASVRAMAYFVRERTNALDLLINNAGILRPESEALL